MAATTKGDLTQVLYNALAPAHALDVGSVSLQLARASIVNALAKLLASSVNIDAVQAPVLELKKSGEKVLHSIDTVLSSVAYFVSKLQLYADEGYFRTHLSEIVRALAAKAKVISEELPSDLVEVSASANESTKLVAKTAYVASAQLVALQAAVTDLQAQREAAQALVDIEQKRKAYLYAQLSTSFKHVLSDGLFSKASVDTVATALKLKLGDKSALGKATASLDAITASLEHVQLETQALDELQSPLLGASTAFSAVKIAFSGLVEVFSKTAERLSRVPSTINAQNVDWGLFDASFPSLLQDWKAFYNTLARSTIEVSKVKPLASGQLKRTRAGVRASSFPTSRTMLVAAAPPVAGTPRANVKAALAPASDATEKVADLTENIELVKTKVVDMRTRLSQSQWAASLTAQVVEFEKNYNELEVRAKTLAGQIAYFGQKNVKVLNLLKASANAGTLTVEVFKSDISYLERKVKVFVDASGGMTLEHKNLKTDMGAIGGALVAAQAQLNTLIPEYEKNLQKAQEDLDKEKDKQKRAGIMRAVANALSTIGGGASMLGVLSGNLAVAGFGIAATLVGTALNIVANLTDGDPSLISQLQAQIAQLKVQIPDLKLAQDAMQPCIDDSKIIQDTLQKMSDTWQIVTINLNNIDRDYKSWLDKDFELDDFLLDVDDDIGLWNKVIALLEKLAGGQEFPDSLSGAPDHVINAISLPEVPAALRTSPRAVAPNTTALKSSPRAQPHTEASAEVSSPHEHHLDHHHHHHLDVSHAIAVAKEVVHLTQDVVLHFATSSYNKWNKCVTEHNHYANLALYLQQFVTHAATGKDSNDALLHHDAPQPQASSSCSHSHV